MPSKKTEPRNVTVLAFVSLLNDIASEATIRLIPLFLSHTLGVGTAVIGLIEGVADSTATLTRLASGWISDRLPRRKPLVVAGYALSGLTKPFLLIATSWVPVLVIRFVDRLGKGIRTAPRDALVADSAPPSARGRAFGLITALDSVGAFAGLLIALTAVLATGAGPLLTRHAFNVVIILATVPAALAVALVAWGVREARRSPPSTHVAAPTRKPLPRSFWKYMVVLGLFTLSNSSDAFLILKAARAPAPSWMPWIAGTPFALACLIALNASQAATAVPAGHLSDRFGRRRLMLCGWLFYAATYAGFAVLGGAPAILALFLFYGAYYGFTEGAQRSLVADLVEESRLRGRAYGVFGFVVGTLALPASLVFGLVADRFGDSVGFGADAVAALLACAGLTFLVPKKNSV